MTENINCPFCGNSIEPNVAKCPHCGALFKEPELPGIKFKELGPFVAIDVLTFGFFSTIWFFINNKAINKLAENAKDSLKLNWLIALLAINGAVYLLFFYKHAVFLALLTLLQCIIYIALSYRVFRIIQKYTLATYNAEILFNPHYMLIFNIFYLVHFIDTYCDRVYRRHEYFDWKSPQAIMLIILLLIVVFMFRFGYEIYEYATRYGIQPFASALFD